MTTIAAYLNGSSAAIAADNQWTGRVGFRGATSKIRRFGDLVVGFAGSGVFTAFASVSAYKPSRAGVLEFAKDYRKFQIELGHVRVDERSQNVTAGDAIVVTPGALFLVSPDGSVIEAAEGYLSIGSGHEVAYGALHLVRKHLPNLDALSAVLAALDAATAHDPWTGGTPSAWGSEWANGPLREIGADVLRP